MLKQSKRANVKTSKSNKRPPPKRQNRAKPNEIIHGARTMTLSTPTAKDEPLKHQTPKKVQQHMGRH